MNRKELQTGKPEWKTIGTWIAIVGGIVGVLTFYSNRTDKLREMRQKSIETRPILEVKQAHYGWRSQSNDAEDDTADMTTIANIGNRVAGKVSIEIDGKESPIPDIAPGES